MSGRTLYIGDVHGCINEFGKLLSEFKFIVGYDKLYLTGDVVSKGPNSLKCLELMKACKGDMVMGNHEYEFIKAYNFMREGNTQAYDYMKLRFPNIPENEWDRIYRMIKNAPLMRYTKHGILVHAGINPVKGASGTSDQDKLMTKYYYDTPWFEVYKGPEFIIFGHWPMLEVVRTPYVIGLDTNCVKGGKLTGWCPEEDKLYEVKAEKVYHRTTASNKTDADTIIKVRKELGLIN